MALADDIQALRDRALANLSTAYDYYSHTKIAWGIVRQSVLAGHKFALKTIPEVAIGLEHAADGAPSPVLNINETGTKTTEAMLAAKAREYTEIQLPEATFQQFISIFEAFLADFLRFWLLAYPKSLGSSQVKFKTILMAADKDAITRFVVDKQLNEVTYKSPHDWFKYLEERAKLGVPTEDEVNQFSEAKASRDILVHNGGLANKIYESKAGDLARYKAGDRIEIPSDYHKATWELIRKMIADISNAAIAKPSHGSGESCC